MTRSGGKSSANREGKAEPQRMHVREALRTALSMIRAHKLRAFFTVLGTVVGVTFLIAVITLIEGMDTYMKKDFAGQVYGFNTVQIRRRPSVTMSDSDEMVRQWRRRPRLTFDDAAWIGERMETPGVMSISSSNSGRVTGPRGRALDNVMVTGASASYFRIRDLVVEHGRPFSDHEAERGIPVVVLGRKVAESLFEGRSALDNTVRIQNFPYRVIGVLEEQGTLFGLSMDNIAIAPARSPVNGFVNPHNVVDEIAYKVPDAQLLPVAMAEAEGWMRIRHRLRPSEPNSFEVETADAALGFWNKFTQIMFVALPGLVGISLLVGAVVIMNIMLVSVTDRTREIGLRKSLGATRREILWQFLVESMTVTTIGGMIGLAVGAGGAFLLSMFTPIPASVPLWSILAALGVSAISGIGFGMYPANKAARLDPVEALRYE
jgi:putative ABC transport system permease protein